MKLPESPSDLKKKELVEFCYFLLDQNAELEYVLHKGNFCPYCGTEIDGRLKFCPYCCKSTT